MGAGARTAGAAAAVVAAAAAAAIMVPVRRKSRLCTSMISSLGVSSNTRRDVIARDRFDVRCARELHHDVKIVAQIFEHALGAEIAAEREAVENRPAASNDVRA